MSLLPKKRHIANYYTKPIPVPKDDNKNGKGFKAIQLRAVTFS